MPYTENHLLLRWGGAAFSDTEEWSCQMRLRVPGGDAAGPMLDLARDIVEDCATALAAWVDRSATNLSGGSQLEFVQLNPISAADGRYLFPNTPVEYLFDNPVTSGRPYGFPQIAYCVTQRSSLYRRGPATRGRFYVPMTAAADVQPTTTGVIPAVAAQGMADSAGTLFTDLATLQAPGDPVTVIPWLYGDGQGGPRDSPIGEVFVGNVADTQRRRRNQIVETYFAGGYDPV